VVKPTIENGFEYKQLHWADLPLPPSRRAPPSVEAGDATLAPLSRHAGAPRWRGLYRRPRAW
jgi:hypothetical protein